MANGDTPNLDAPNILETSYCPSLLTFDHLSVFSFDYKAKAKYVHEKMTYIKALYGFLDGFIISYSLVKYFFDLVTPADQNSAVAMHEWLGSPDGASIATAECMSIIVLSMIGNTLDESKEPLIKGMAKLWPYLRDGFKGLKFAYKGVRSVLQLAQAMGAECQTMLLPIGLVLGVAAAANRIWYRNQVTEVRKDYQKKNNTLLLRAQNLGYMDDDKFTLSPLPDDETEALDHHKVYLRLDGNEVEYKVYNPQGDLETGTLTLDDLQYSSGALLTVDGLIKDSKIQILDAICRKGSIANTNTHSQRQSILANMVRCCAFNMQKSPNDLSIDQLTAILSPFTAGYIRVNDGHKLNALYYVDLSNKTVIEVCNALSQSGLKKLASYDNAIFSDNSARGLFIFDLEKIQKITGHTHVPKQLLPDRKWAMGSSIFGGFVDGLYTYMGAISLVALSPGLFGAVAATCIMFTVICVVNRAFEEEGYQNDFLRSQLNVELVLLSKEIQDLFVQLQDISVLCAGMAKEDGSHAQDKDFINLRIKGDRIRDLLDLRTTAFHKQKKKYDEIVVLSTPRAILTGLRNGLYVYSAISSIVFAWNAFCIIGFGTFTPGFLVFAVALGVVSLICTVVDAVYSNNKHLANQKMKRTLPDIHDIEVRTLFDLVKSYKNTWEISGVIQPEPVRERDILADGLHTDPSPQYHVQEWLEVVRSFFSGLSKGQKAVDWECDRDLIVDARGHYQESPFYILMGCAGSVVYCLVYALRAFGKGLRGSNEVPLPLPQAGKLPESKTLSPDYSRDLRINPSAQIGSDSQNDTLNSLSKESSDMQSTKPRVLDSKLLMQVRRQSFPLLNLSREPLADSSSSMQRTEERSPTRSPTPGVLTTWFDRQRFDRQRSSTADLDSTSPSASAEEGVGRSPSGRFFRQGPLVPPVPIRPSTDPSTPVLPSPASTKP